MQKKERYEPVKIGVFALDAMDVLETSVLGEDADTSDDYGWDNDF